MGACDADTDTVAQCICICTMIHPAFTCELACHRDCTSQLSKYDMEHVIEKEMSGHLKEGMLAIGECMYK